MGSLLSSNVLFPYDSKLKKYLENVDQILVLLHRDIQRRRNIYLSHYIFNYKMNNQIKTIFLFRVNIAHRKSYQSRKITLL